MDGIQNVGEGYGIFRLRHIPSFLTASLNSKKPVPAEGPAVEPGASETETGASWHLFPFVQMQLRNYKQKLHLKTKETVPWKFDAMLSKVHITTVAISVYDYFHITFRPRSGKQSLAWASLPPSVPHGITHAVSVMQLQMEPGGSHTRMHMYTSK